MRESGDYSSWNAWPWRIEILPVESLFVDHRWAG